jgi:acyl carrier protein
MEKAEIFSKILGLILQSSSQGQLKEQITNETPLLSSRLLDSIAVLRLVTLIEEEFNIEIEAFEVNVDNLDTIAKIAEFVSKKSNA